MEAEVRIDDVGRLDVVGYRGSYPEIVIDAKTGATPYANQFACYLRWFENATPATSSRVLIALVCRIRRSRRSGSGRRSGQTGLTSSADAANRCTTIRTLRTRQREQHFLEVNHLQCLMKTSDRMVHDMSSVQDRVEGVLIGLAAGDRIGGPVRMAIRLAESLLERGAFDCSDVAARYQAWWREGAFDTGPVAARVFELVASGYSFDAASERVHLLTDGETAGCNPAHRSAPLAMMPGSLTGRWPTSQGRRPCLPIGTRWRATSPRRWC